jgi:hypothetical protein
VETGEVLVKGEIRKELKLSEQTKYIFGVGKLIHMMWWSRPDIYNSTRELSRFMTSGTTPSHVKVTRRVMEYSMATENEAGN